MSAEKVALFTAGGSGTEAAVRATRLVTPIEFQVSDGAGYITGQNIKVDGGVTRSV
ncbi:hypothetical protein [Rhizobium setariae]|uniref:hypothetical protein n=1 Tax=Rhizobium setariae TaxID=2801340 RepID=UPI001FF06E7C|nr:hypothetical protein [Rhizobium setariae]